MYIVCLFSVKFAIYAAHVEQACNSLQLTRIYGRNMQESCIINIKTLRTWLVVKFVCMQRKLSKCSCAVFRWQDKITT